MGAEQSNETQNLMKVEGSYDSMTEQHFFARFQPEPFAEGTMRWCYSGVILDSETGKICKTPDFPDGRCVVKAFKEGTAVDSKLWTEDFLNSFFAEGLAQQFNKDVPTTRPLCFAVPYLAQVDHRAGTKVMGMKVTPADVKAKLEAREWVAIEPYIIGEYKKFTSNSGWTDESGIGRLIPAFMHWTWVRTHGEIVVSDIQGVRREDRYLLTDPAVQSLAQRFGATDLGVDGIVRFLANHKHSELCQSMPWPHQNVVQAFSAARSAIPCRRGTTFNVQVAQAKKEAKENLRAQYVQYCQWAFPKQPSQQSLSPPIPRPPSQQSLSPSIPRPPSQQQQPQQQQPQVRVVQAMPQQQQQQPQVHVVQAGGGVAGQPVILTVGGQQIQIPQQQQHAQYMQPQIQVVQASGGGVAGQPVVVMAGPGQPQSLPPGVAVALGMQQQPAALGAGHVVVAQQAVPGTPPQSSPKAHRHRH